MQSHNGFWAFDFGFELKNKRKKKFSIRKCFCFFFCIKKRGIACKAKMDFEFWILDLN